MIKLFDKNGCIDICCENSNKYVLRALEDLLCDFGRVNTEKAKPRLVEKAEDAAMVITENKSSDVLDEGFEITVKNGKIYINANSYIGTMWGIYTFSEKVLGVEPLYLFNDLETEKKDELYIDTVEIKEAPSGFNFRGVFINDEDLLSDWKEGGGKRLMDYQWYGTTVAPDVIKRVAETMVRLKINLVIPASFLDIDNPPEKALADVIASRGIFVSQHHLEPCGVSSFTFENYCKKHNVTGEFSYIKNPELMKQAWRDYVEKWAQYDNVVWQIGLRGKADRPIWGESIPTKEQLMDYGSVISKAYEEQKQIVLEATKGKAKYFTSTLWMEGAGLMKANALTIPDDTVIVFADNGVNQMYAPDFYEVERKENIKYGIYYHVQYFNYGPHLAPLTGIDKLYYNLKLAKDKNDTAYCILNSSNIREFTYELKAYSQMMWNFDGFDVSEYKTSYSLIFGDKAQQAEKLVEDYYDAIAVMDTNSLPKHHGKYFNYKLDDNPKGIKNFTAKDGMIVSMGENIVSSFLKEMDHDLHDEIYERVTGAVEKYAKTEKGFEELMDEVESHNIKRHIQSKWLLYSYCMHRFYSWYILIYLAKTAYDAKDTQKARRYVEEASQQLENVLEYRKKAEYGYFENWYRGDTKLDIPLRLNNTKMLLEKI